MTRRDLGICMAGVLAAFVLVTAGPDVAVAEGVSAVFVPAATTVVPGSQFDLELWVPQTSHVFNGFEVKIAYDTSALTLVPLSPVSSQQGTLLTNACANTFHRFVADMGLCTITDILLCNGVSVTGPGQIYRLRFRASTTIQATMVRIVEGSLKFYDAGLFVFPDSWSNAAIGIGMEPVAVGDGAVGLGLSLAAAPNPTRGRVTFTIGGSPAGPESLTVRDVQGRRICRLAPSGRQVTWDGRHELGYPVPNGTYFATLQAGGRSITTRFILLR
jgi:hypothetical protein